MAAIPNGAAALGSGASGLAADGRSIDALKRNATQDPKSAIKDAAKQFEALFMQQLMKNMRQSGPGAGLLENSGTQLGNELLDAQYANKMSGLPGGFASVIARQLERQTAGANTTTGLPATPKPVSVLDGATIPTRQAAFVQRHDAAAKAVAAETGIPATFMVAQAAHESGWGQREIRNKDGSSANNLFGIKAGSGWDGPVAEVSTTEYVDGQARKTTAKFRAYSSYEESFRDYARLIKDNPRYQQAYQQAQQQTVAGKADGAAFAQSLQRAGYATDPAYADKLTRMINTTLRLQRSMA